MKKHKHNQPGRHNESEHEELIRLRLEIESFKAENKLFKKENEFFKAQNEFFKTENAVIKKEIALREQRRQRVSRGKSSHRPGTQIWRISTDIPPQSHGAVPLHVSF